MRKVSVILCIVVGIIMSACTQKNAISSRDWLTKANDAILGGDTITALACLDSVHALFPKDIPARRIADTISWQIQLVQATHSLPLIEQEIAYNDSVMTALLPRFKFFKDERYEDIGHFEHRLMSTERGVNRCYLKPSIDEHGAATLSSFYYGNDQQHIGFRLEIDSMIVDSHEIQFENITKFDDAGEYHEILQLTPEQSTQFLQTLYTYRDSRIKVALYENSTAANADAAGHRVRYTYYISNVERIALAESYQMHYALHTIFTLNDLQLRTQQKIELLNKRLSAQ